MCLFVKSQKSIKKSLTTWFLKVAYDMMGMRGYTHKKAV